MHNPVSQEQNRQNLIDVASLLGSCEHFPFFGTLLGLTRNGDIIPHDDDVDIYASILDRKKILDCISKSDFTIDWQDTVNASRWFLQAKRWLGGVDSFVDIYFYEPMPELGCVVERWNFSGQWQSDDNHIHVPAEFIYPIGKKEFFGVEIAMPADPVKCCQFLYGSQWQRPLIKRLGYKTKVVDHAPSIEVSPDQFSEVVRQFYELDETVLSQKQKLVSQEKQLAQKWQELIAANQRLVEAGEEIGRWQERTMHAETELDEIKSTHWWRTRSITLDSLNSIKSLFKR